MMRSTCFLCVASQKISWKILMLQHGSVRKISSEGGWRWLVLSRFSPRVPKWRTSVQKRQFRSLRPEARSLRREAFWAKPSAEADRGSAHASLQKNLICPANLARWHDYLDSWAVGVSSTQKRVA